MGYLSKNFHTEELACPCCKHIEMNSTFIRNLQKLRDLMNCPLVITSGYRCKNHNKTIGSKASRHLQGQAVDISTQGWTPYVLHKFLNIATDKNHFYGGVTGIGIYKNHVHFDLRYKEHAWWGE